MGTASVIFICTANICRSPMAAALFKQTLEERRQADPALSQDWRIESAGTWARDGDIAAAGSQWVMQESGLDLSEHRSRSVSLDLLKPFHLILVMEQGHKEALKVEFPGLAGRVFLLSEMAGKRGDIRDPFMGELDDYQNTARELSQLIGAGFERICQLAQGVEEEKL